MSDDRILDLERALAETVGMMYALRATAGIALGYAAAVTGDPDRILAAVQSGFTENREPGESIVPAELHECFDQGFDAAAEFVSQLAIAISVRHSHDTGSKVN